MPAIVGLAFRTEKKEFALRRIGVTVIRTIYDPAPYLAGAVIIRYVLSGGQQRHGVEVPVSSVQAEAARFPLIAHTARRALRALLAKSTADKGAEA